MVTPTNHVIRGLDLHCVGPWYFGNFRNIFLPNIGEKKTLPPEREAPGTVPYGISVPSYCITLIKR